MTPVETLQTTLAGEHAAVYVYGVVGARLSASAEPALWNKVQAAYSRHRGRRDQLAAMVRETGDDPVAADVSYVLPNPATTTAQLVRVARGLEQRSAVVYAEMVSRTTGVQRQWAIDALEDAAVRGLGFGAGPEVFPGIAEL